MEGRSFSPLCWRLGVSFVGVALLLGVLALAAAGRVRAQGTGAREAGPLVEVVRAIKPGVVAVGTYDFNAKPNVRFYGTGFAVGSGRQLVTNHHVLGQIRENGDEQRLRVFHPTLPGRGLEARVAAEDEVHDLALLSIEEGRLAALRLGDSEGVREGECVAFTGYPIGLVLGLNPTTHAGIVSAISPILVPSPTARAIESDLIPYLRDPFDVFQVDATAFPGNSGSPLYRRRTGEVVGVINLVFVKGKKEHILKEPTGITYAIPIVHVHEMLRRTPQGKGKR